MKIYFVPDMLETIIFDIDSTLYTNKDYEREQVDCQIRHYADVTGIPHAQAREKINNFRLEWKKQHQGADISLGNTFIALGVPIEESIRWREQFLEPKLFLAKDERLVKTLFLLKKRFKLICVTNNPEIPARKTLVVLGVNDFFPEIVALDTCKVSKPHPLPFELAAQKTQTKPSRCVSIGDRYHIDISLPLELGMGGILVDGVQDVYKLPGILCNK